MNFTPAAKRRMHTIWKLLNSLNAGFFFPSTSSNIKTKQVNLQAIQEEQDVHRRSSSPPPHPHTIRHFTLPYESLQFNSTAKVVWEQLIWELDCRSRDRSDWVDDFPTTSSPTSAPTSRASWHHWHSTSSMIMSSAQILLYKPAVRSQPECPD